MFVFFHQNLKKPCRVHLIQEISNRIHVSRTPNKPEKSHSSNRNFQNGLRWDSVPFQFLNGFQHPAITDPKLAGGLIFFNFHPYLGKIPCRFHLRDLPFWFPRVKTISRRKKQQRWGSGEPNAIKLCGECTGLGGTGHFLTIPLPTPKKRMDSKRWLFGRVSSPYFTVSQR